MIYTITLNEQEVNLVGVGLSQLQFKDVAGLIANLQQQVNDQQKPAEQPSSSGPY